jgi:GxxExxY protein
MAEIFLKEESYKIIGICMAVHNELGMGFREAVYKEALEIELKNENIPYEREKCFPINYKGKILKKRYPVDFFVFDNIILEIKASSVMLDSFVSQTMNYLKSSGLTLGIIVNFGQRSLVYKRVVV